MMARVTEARRMRSTARRSWPLSITTNSNSSSSTTSSITMRTVLMATVHLLAVTKRAMKVTCKVKCQTEANKSNKSTSMRRFLRSSRSARRTMHCLVTLSSPLATSLCTRTHRTLLNILRTALRSTGRDPMKLPLPLRRQR